MPVTSRSTASWRSWTARSPAGRPSSRTPGAPSTAASARRASTSPSGRGDAASAARCSRPLIESARNGGLWTLQAGVFPDNVASLELHRRLGFREVGVRERIGELDGVWRDVVLLELRL